MAKARSMAMWPTRSTISARTARLRQRRRSARQGHRGNHLEVAGESPPWTEQRRRMDQAASRLYRPPVAQCRRDAPRRLRGMAGFHQAPAQAGNLQRRRPRRIPAKRLYRDHVRRASDAHGFARTLIRLQGLRQSGRTPQPGARLSVQGWPRMERLQQSFRHAEPDGSRHGWARTIRPRYRADGALGHQSRTHVPRQGEQAGP
jgi:hypothetical protein